MILVMRQTGIDDRHQSSDFVMPTEQKAHCKFFPYVCLVGFRALITILAD